MLVGGWVLSQCVLAERLGWVSQWSTVILDQGLVGEVRFGECEGFVCRRECR